MKPLVSIIMPAYNGADYISDAIKSVTKQTYSNWELDIVDDNSSDNTLDIIRLFKDERIRVRCNHKNMGISFASNRAMEMSNSKYIALLDDDDMATEQRLELQVEYLETHPEIDVLGGRAIIINDKSEVIGYDDTPLHNPNLIKAYMHFVNKRFSNGTTMLRREFLEKNGIRFEEGCYGIQDWKLMIDCSKYGNISAIDQLLQYKRIHDNEATWHYLCDHQEARRIKYAELQRESIIKSGYELTDDQIKIITDCVTETKRRNITEYEANSLWKVLQEMIKQAYEKKFNYAKEMEYACKKIFFEQILLYISYNRLKCL